MSEILLFLLALLLLPYLLVPILIRRNQYFSLKPKLRQVTNDFLPTCIAQHFNQASDELVRLGFEHRIDAISLDYGPNLRVFLRLFVATGRSVIAICTALLPDGSNAPLKHFIEFNSRFDGGREVSTHNSDLAGAPIEHRHKVTSALPKVCDVKMLLAFHEHVIERLGLSSQQSVLPEQGCEFDFMVQSFKDDLSRQATLGCLRLDQANNCYRPTWAGAFLMGWYAMWPVSTIRRYLYRLKAKLWVRELEKASA